MFYQTKNKLSAFLFALYFFFCAFTFTSFYAEASSPNDKQVYKSGDYEYVLTSDGTAEITDYFGYDYSLTIPSTLGGHKVTHLGDYAFDKGDFFEVSIPDSVTTIGANPFKRCYNLGKIVVSSDHTHFALIEGILYSKDEKELICCPISAKKTDIQIPHGILSIGEHGFGGCEYIKSITVPDSVTHIGEGAFQWCYDLSDLVLPNSITYIGDYAFDSCSSLTKLTLPNNVTHIGSCAFSDCSKLKQITIPDSVSSMGGSPFYDCDKLEVILPESNPYFQLIDGFIYNINAKKLIGRIPNAPQITTFDIPQGTISIENYAFEDCDSLTRVTIPESVTHIGYAAFQYCTSLAEIIIPDSVTFIDGYAFSYCDSLTNIVIPEGLTYIGWFAFAFNESLTQINIPRSVTYIGEGAFNGLDFATIVIERNTYAEKWAKENGLVFSYPNSNDWLN